jgi:uncharacterized membrane protein
MANFHVLAGPGEGLAHPEVRKIGFEDLTAALAEGWRDFWQKPSHLVFLGLIYPVMGVALAFWTSGVNAWPLLFPLISGFALIGPIAALPLYEMSRRQELGLDTHWRSAFGVFRSPAMPSIAAVGMLLFVIFALWLYAAQTLYESQFGYGAPASLLGFLNDVFTTEAGRNLIVWGFAVGFLFAVASLATAVISIPLLLDRDVGAAVAVQTSIRAVIANPVVMAAWGLIVAALLVIGSLPLLVGLAIVVPVLGHATWHLYRKVVVPESVS